jgi:PAS domain S-box-containing protein
MFLIIIIGQYVDMQHDAMRLREKDITVGLEKMVRLDHELAGMLTIAALEKNVLRTASYNTINSDLEETVKAVYQAMTMQALRYELTDLLEGHKKLYALEQEIISQMKMDNWTEAGRILFGDEYLRTKKTYEIDIETAVTTVTGELAEKARNFELIRITSLSVRFGALLVLLFVGIMFSRRMRSDLLEQIRLKNELTVANEAMEDRVRERTADLEKTTKSLALENEERLKADARTRLILDSAGEGIFGVDTEGRVTFFNSAAETLLGYTADELIGKEIHGLIHHSYADGTPYPPEKCPLLHTSIDGEEKNVVDEVLWRKNGSNFPSEYSVTPISDDKGDIVGSVIVFRNITERKNNEEELNRRMEDLERFNRLTMGREERMIQLKQEVNALLEKMGREKKYGSTEDKM